MSIEAAHNCTLCYDKGMISRIWIYLWETFKIPSRVLLTLTNVLVVQLFVMKSLDTFTFILGSSMLFFSLLYYRTCDEFKDEKTDKIFFPKRPLPSGRVLKSDLRLLQILCGLIMIGITIVQSEARLFAIILILDCLLMQFYFFAPKLMEKNRLIAFATHAPYAFVVNFYLLALHADIAKTQIFTLENIALVSVLSLPGFHWEIIRKTFVRERPGYQTYSSLLGYQGAILLSLVFFFPLLIGLRILLVDNFFIPLVSIIIIYCMHIWGLGLKEEEGLVSLRTKSELISTTIIICLLWQGFSFL